ncbi:proteasome component pup2 [Ceratobasidium sp. 392]|nr:proteasome component pup2 [Ceratobasidium sp. 392]
MSYLRDDLSIDIERNSSVTACLRQFSASEMLCQKNKFFCDSCCGLQEAEKRMKIKKLPNVLALHLKRFKYQEDVQRYMKLSYRVAFPFELRLFNTVDDAQDPDRLYELFAIVVHVGSGPHHGHYITIAKQRGQWLLFDDDIVEGIRESEIPKYFGDSPAGSGYVLFYQAVNIDLQALGVKSPPSPQTSTVLQPQSVPPVIVETPTSPVAAEEKAEVKGSPDVSESGTIGTPSTPTPSHPPSSPVLSKLDAPSTAPTSQNGSAFKASIRQQTPLSGSISGLTESTTSSVIGAPNGDTALPVTKNGKTKELSGSWFRWGSKKKSKETPSSSKKTTMDDQIPVLDIRRPSAPANLGSTLGPPAEREPLVFHDEPEQTLAPTFGLGVDFGASGQMTDEPVSAPVSASSSGDHLHSGALPQSANHLHPHSTYKPMAAHASPPRASRSGSVSGTTNGSGSGSTSGLHVPSYRPSSQASPSASSSASSVSTPLRHNASAPKLNFPLTMSPMKQQKRPSTASFIYLARLEEGEDGVVDYILGHAKSYFDMLESVVLDASFVHNRGVNTFSPEGRLFQVEYAIEAIKLGSTTVGIKTKEGVVLGVEKRVQSPLLEASSIEKIMEIDTHLGCAMSGLTADARTMIDHARLTSQNHAFTYNEQIKVESVTQAVCDLALRFGESMDNEDAMMSRPFGVALLIAGIDELGPQLYHTDPSGTFVRYEAKAIGSGSEAAQSELQDKFHQQMTLVEAQNLTLKILKQVMEEKLDHHNVQIAQAS